MSETSPDGVTRWAVILADAAAAAAAPPGIDGRAYALAMCEDVIELVGELSIVTPAVLTRSRGDLRWAEDVAALCWPGTPLAEAASVEGSHSGGAAVLTGLAFATAAGADAAAVVAGDAPDLPGLLLGKLFRALGSAQIAVSSTEDGELVALAARLPAPDWLPAEIAGLDDPAGGVVERLSAAAGDPRRVASGPGWHRLRLPADVRRLDPGLEGWASTRALLSVPARD
ncbi:MAG: hypothetical protein QOJ11_767 [Frankiales bacterium]|jgi:hypothetical protein|nr:hypothetical protein [Frankiales bacterium]